MSTYYYLVCDSHRLRSDTIGGRSFPSRWWETDDGALAAFLEAHAECQPNPRLISEHASEWDEYDEIPAASRETQQGEER